MSIKYESFAKKAYNYNPNHSYYLEAGKQKEDIYDFIRTENSEVLTLYACETLNIIATYYSIPKETLTMPNRCDAKISKARQIAMYLFHTLTGCNLTMTGDIFKRDRTTVAYACARIEDERDDIDFDNFIADLEIQLIKSFSAIQHKFKNITSTKEKALYCENKNFSYSTNYRKQPGYLLYN